MNVVEVKELMGHEDLKTTMKYLHPNTAGSGAVVNQRNHSKSLHFAEGRQLKKIHTKPHTTALYEVLQIGCKSLNQNGADERS